jgi:hypothetical protein
MLERWIADLKIAEVLPGFVEAGMVCATLVVRIGELNGIIFPPANGAA